MATTGRLHPTEVGNNPGVWGTPENILGATQDGACGFKGTNLPGTTWDCYLKTFRDSAGNPPNIPTGSTITKMILGQSALQSNDHDGVTFYVSLGGVSWAVDHAASGTLCSQCTYGTVDHTLMLPTVSDINNEVYTAFVRFYKSGAGITYVRTDNVSIEFEYTPPSAGGVQAQVI